VVGYSVIFLLLTSVGVAGIRSNFGTMHSLASRYTIYSALLLIFAWFAVVEEWLMHEPESPRYKQIFLSAAVFAVLFSVAMDVWGLRFLTRRNRDLVIGMNLYEQNQNLQPAPGPIFPPPKTKEEQDFNRQARDILTRAAKLGIYQP
jgi:hypothetical protein